MKSIQFRRNITIILVTALILILIYLTYTLIYTKTMEDRMVQTRFRALDQVSGNFKSKIDSYKKNAYIYEEAIKDKSGKTDAQVADSIKKLWAVYNDDLEFLKKLTGPKETFEISHDSVFFNTRSLRFYLPNDYLLKNIAREDVFSDFLILTDSSVLYNSMTDDYQLVSVKSGGKKDESPGITYDTLLLSENGYLEPFSLQSSRSYNINLANVDYKLFIKPIMVDRQNLFLCGLETTSAFNHERQSIPPWFIIVLSLILFLIILSLPFFKLRLMSKSERLGAGTISNVAVAIILGASFLIFFIFFQAHNFSRSKEINLKLQALSIQIQKNFKAEMQSVYLQLNKSDSLFREKTGLPGSTPVLETDILSSAGEWKPDAYPYFDYLFWLNTKGMQIHQISPFSKTEQLINLSGRDYFNKKDEWYWPYSQTIPREKFYFESIVSVKSGDYKAAFSMPSDSTGLVVAMTGRFYSLIDPILPKDFKFCIVDKTGKVWFHSNKFHNLAENLLEECDGDRLLQAALYADVSKSLNVSYYNKPQRIFIEPIEGFPLNVVTMYDLKSEQAYQAQVFVTTVVLISFIFAFLVIQVVLLQLIRRYFGKKANGNPLVEFTRPQKRQNSNYKCLIITYVLVLVLLAAWTVFSPMNNLTSALSVFIMVTFMLTFTYIHLHNYKWKETGVIIYAIINLVLIIGISVIFFTAHNSLEEREFLTFILTLILVVASSVLLFRKENDWLKISTARAFSMLIFLLVLAFGVAPILEFFGLAVSLENNIGIRHTQLELLKAREDRNAEYIRYYKKINDISGISGNPGRDAAHSSRKEKGIYTLFWDSTYFSEPQNYTYTAREYGNPGKAGFTGYPDTLINQFRPVYDKISLESKYLMFDSLPNRPFNWVTNDNNALDLVYISSSEDFGHKEQKRVTLHSKIPSTNVFMPFFSSEKGFLPFLGDMLVYMILLFILYLIFKLILFSTRKVYGILPEEDSEIIDFKTLVGQQLEGNKSIILVNSSSLVGLEIFNAGLKKEFKAVDLKLEDTPDISSSRTYVINDFFKDYQDPQNFLVKLRNMNLWLASSSKLIILVENRPEVVQAYYRDKAESTKPADSKDDKKPGENSDSYKQVYTLLRNILAGINVMQIPLYVEDWEKPAEPIAAENVVHDIFIKAVIYEEINVSSYLRGFIKPLSEYCTDLKKLRIDDDEIKERMITRVISLAGKYYQGLFESCTPEEKFILLDIASDSVMNTKNADAIISLLAKGILVSGGDSVRVMNESFRRYLVHIDAEVDRQELKKALGSDQGDWMGYKIALALIILALFVFIFISNQDFLKNMNKMFLALGASIGGISTVVGLLGGKKKGL